ncbi:MAG: S41 family peptidase, partial [Clostridiales bacterium]|nr:S41 family peptidase [Clostridiales bacterium]
IVVVVIIVGVELYVHTTGRYIVVGRQSISVTDDSKSDVVDDEFAAKLSELIDYMDIYYYEDYDVEEVQNSVYKGLIEGLGDKYSEYYTAEEYESTKSTTNGNYYGIGVELIQNSDTLEVTVNEVYDGAPAEEAGILAGDMIIAAEGTAAEDVSLNDLVAIIKGEEGTTVRLTIYRPSTGETFDVDVERRNVEITTVAGEMVTDDIGYIEITEFQNASPSQFESVLADLQDQGMEALIVDLRDNPGGTLTSVIDILDTVLPEGTLVYTEDKYGNREDFTSDANCLDCPMAVLVNGNSASASEIFAGAVKDYGWGTIIGTTTYGKGIVQTIFPLSDGDAVKVTTARYFTPNGNNIHGTGIEPDDVVEYEYTGEDDTEWVPEHDSQAEYAI